MFSETQIKILQKQLNFKNREKVIYFITRLKGWINTNSSTSTSLLKGLTLIIKDIHEQEIEEATKIKQINLTSIKHPIIIKFAQEIMELRKQGHGAKSIITILNLQNKIAHSTLHSFLKKQEQENG